MSKSVKCPACKGKGKIPPFDKYEPGPYGCTVCKGTGIKPPMPDKFSDVVETLSPHKIKTCPWCGGEANMPAVPLSIHREKMRIFAHRVKHLGSMAINRDQFHAEVNAELARLLEPSTPSEPQREGSTETTSTETQF